LLLLLQSLMNAASFYCLQKRLATCSLWRPRSENRD
jgi:hypothetical protein